MWLAVTAIDPIALQAANPLPHSVTWVGNSFPGASNRWVQNFFIHTRVQPDGTVNTWSHWDEGGKKFGVYKDGDDAHLVFVEENDKAKSLIYRWKPQP